MKTLEKKPQITNGKQTLTPTFIDENQEHPRLEQKLKEANDLLKKVGLPKELVR